MKAKWIAFVKTETGADIAALSEATIKLLAQYCLNVMALQSPRIATLHAKELGLA